MRVVEVSTPRPKAGQVLVEVRASGICGSDKHLWHATTPSDSVYGHEVAGSVVELGPGTSTLRVGDRVAVNNVGGCGTCQACREGAFVLCPSWDGSLDVNGGFGEYVAAWERNCMKLAEPVSYEQGCLLFDNFGTPYAALERAAVAGGDSVVVTGCGPIGLGAVRLAALRGANVVAVDPVPSRRAMARSLGAMEAFAPDKATAEALRDVCRGGPRVVIECSAQPSSYETALRALRIEGVLVTVGEGARYELKPSDALIRRRLSILGSWYSTMAQGAAVQTMVASGLFDPSALVTHRGPLADFPELFRIVCEQPADVVKAVIVRGNTR
jgi:threonine dehydrogenase-like Zn-dependent dehydrogenase